MFPVLTTSRFSIQFSCWEEHRFARTKASPVNISHWLASQMYLCSPSLFPSLYYLSTSLSLFHSSVAASSTSDRASPIYPSVFRLQTSISLLPASFCPLSRSLFLCVFFPPPYLPLLLLTLAFVWVLSWNVLRDPVSNTEIRNIWHIFNSQGQLQLFIQRLQLNFPRFLLDLPQIAMCVCHILNQASFLCFPPLPATFHQMFQRLSSEF